MDKIGKCGTPSFKFFKDVVAYLRHYSANQERRDLYGYIHDALLFTPPDRIGDEQLRAVERAAAIASHSRVTDADLDAVASILENAGMELSPLGGSPAKS